MFTWEVGRRWEPVKLDCKLFSYLSVVLSQATQIVGENCPVEGHSTFGVVLYWLIAEISCSLKLDNLRFTRYFRGW